MNEKYDIPVRFESEYSIVTVGAMILSGIFSAVLAYSLFIVIKELFIYGTERIYILCLIMICVHLIPLVIIFAYALSISLGAFYVELTEDGVTYKHIFKKRFDWAEIVSVTPKTETHMYQRENITVTKGVKFRTSENKTMYISDSKFDIDFDKFLNTVNSKANI